MTETTDVNQSQPDVAEDDAGPRRSRREMRQAERAAEREAILTGQQPLLTRRELKRLREEAAALRAAVAAGEITPEQARALQDPLAEQPEIRTPSLEAAGSHAASTPSGSADTRTGGSTGVRSDEGGPDLPASDQRAAGESMGPTPSFARTQAAQTAGRPSGSREAAAPGAGARTAPAHDDETATARSQAPVPSPLLAGAHSAGEPPLSDIAEKRDAESGGYASAPGPASRVADVPEDRSPRTPLAGRPPAAGDVEQGPAPASRIDRPGPEHPASASPGGTGGPMRSAAAGTASPAAPTGLEASEEPVPQVANTSLSDDDIEDISAQPTGVMNAVNLPAAAPPYTAAPATDEPAVMPERRSLLNRETPSASEAGHDEATGSTGVGHDAPETIGLDREAPGAPGSGFQPVGGTEAEPEEVAAPSPPAPSSPPNGDELGTGAAAQPQGLPDWATEPATGGPSRRPIVRIPNAAQGVRTVDTDTGELSDVRPVDEEFDEIDNPQWRVLRPEDEQQPPSGGTGTPDAPDSPPLREAGSAFDESGQAFTPYGPMPEATPGAAPQPGAPAPQPAGAPAPDQDLGWGSRTTPATTTAMASMGPVSERPRTSTMSRILIIVAIVAIVVLVIGALVWFFLNHGGSSSASASTVGAIPTWTSLLG